MELFKAEWKLPHDNMGGTTYNLQSAESRISGYRCCIRMVDFVRTSLLSETSMVLMHQTNKFPQDVLRVLENMK